jgi:hypothetical protein
MGISSLSHASVYPFVLCSTLATIGVYFGTDHLKTIDWKPKNRLTVPLLIGLIPVGIVVVAQGLFIIGIGLYVLGSCLVSTFRSWCYEKTLNRHTCKT